MELDDEPDFSSLPEPDLSKHAKLKDEYLRKRHPDSGNWFLESDAYRRFLNGNSYTLLCTGHQGVGKTMLSSIVIDNLLSRSPGHPDIAIVYVYCGLEDYEDHSDESLLNLILRQLAGPYQLLDISPYALLDTIHTVARRFQQVFLVLDGLDECPVFDELVEAIFTLQDNFNWNLLVTSRDLPIITEMFCNCERFEVRAHDHDLGLYFDARLTAYRSRIQAKERAEIKSVITKAASGSFSLAWLYLESVLSAPSVPEGLVSIATEYTSLHNVAYEPMLSRVLQQDEADRTLAIQALGLITFAHRPLRAIELRCALLQSLYPQEYNARRRASQGLVHMDIKFQRIVNVCLGFVVDVSEDGEIVKFAYDTMQPFFKLKIQPNSSGEEVITRACLEYLSCTAFDSVITFPNHLPRNVLQLREIKARLAEIAQRNPLWRYAAYNWGHHARNSPATHGYVEHFLTTGNLFRSSYDLLMIESAWSVNKTEDTLINIWETGTGLHLAAYFGLTGVLQSMSQKRYHTVHDTVCLSNGLSPTTLHLAAVCGHESTVSFLLHHQAPKDAQQIQKVTPLMMAADHGHRGVVALLLNPTSGRCNVRLADEHGFTALHRAAMHGHTAVVQDLLNAGAIMDQTDHDGSTALHKAVQHDHSEVEQQLLQNDADLSLSNNAGHTPLSLAWQKKSLNWKEYKNDHDCMPKQGRQAERCEVWKRSNKGPPPERVFVKIYTWHYLVDDVAEDFKKTLFREHRILQRLKHPHIVSYLGYEGSQVDSEKTAHIYLEYCDGKDLHSRHVEGVPLAVSLTSYQAESIFIQLALALAYLHYGLAIDNEYHFSLERHWDPVIHRDIKPDNVVLQNTMDDRKFVKLCDLGLSTDTGAHTRGAGSLRYSPPEVQTNGKWTTKGDIYSLGATLSHLWIDSDANVLFSKMITQCQQKEPKDRPSSIKLLEDFCSRPTASDSMVRGLPVLLGQGRGNYMYQALMLIEPLFDEKGLFSQTTAKRRERLVKRAQCLYEDGAWEYFDEHCDSLHLCVVLRLTVRLGKILKTMPNVDKNKRWEKSGWTPLHLAAQEGNTEAASLLRQHDVNVEILDECGNSAEEYYSS